jgi:hypothetical protein
MLEKLLLLAEPNFTDGRKVLISMYSQSQKIKNFGITELKYVKVAQRRAKIIKCCGKDSCINLQKRTKPKNETTVLKKFDEKYTTTMTKTTERSITTQFETSKSTALKETSWVSSLKS